MIMSRDELRVGSGSIEERWNAFRRYLASIRDTGYARAAQIAAKDPYGIDEITDSTYKLLSDRDLPAPMM